MKHKFFSVPLAVLLAVGMVLVGPLPAAAQAQPLDSMLALVPQAAMAGETAYLSYANLDMLVRSMPDAAMPAPGQPLAEHMQTPQGKAYFKAVGGAAAGISNLGMYLMYADDFRGSMGIDIAHIAQTMEVGQPPGTLALLQGSFNSEAIQAALKQKDYQAAQESQGMWCPDGDCALGYHLDLQRRDPAFLFGGDLGRRWPVAMGNEWVAASANSALVEAMAAGQGPTLQEDADLMALVRGVTQPEGEAAAQLAQLILVSPHLAVTRANAFAGLVALAHVQTPDALWVVIGLTYPDEETAQDAKTRLEGSVPQAKLMSGQPLAQVLSVHGGTLRELRVLPGLQGKGLLLLPFRFPTQQQAILTNDQALTAVPYAAFVQMLMRRDLDWLAP